MYKFIFATLFTIACFQSPSEASEQTNAADLAQHHISNGNELAKNGHYREALDELNIAIASNPTNARAYKLRGHVYYALGEYAKSLADLDHVVSLAPSSANAYCDRAIANSQAGHHGQALADIDQALKLSPDSEFAQAVRKVVLEKAAE